MRRALITFVLLILAAILAAAIFLHSDRFRTVRLQVSEQYLSQALRYPLEIDGDVRISLVPTPVITATGLRIPATNEDDPHRAALSELRAYVDPRAVLNDMLLFPRLEARGLDLNVFRAEKRVTNWTRPARQRPLGQRRTIVDILGERDVDIVDAHIFFSNELNGFDFDFALDRFVVAQPMEGQSTLVSTQGTLNAAALEMNGDFAPGQPFEIEGQIGEQRFKFNSDGEAGTAVTSFAGQLALETGDLADLMHVLQLEGDVSGTGTVATQITNSEGQLSFDDLEVVLQLENDNTTRVDGWFHSHGTGQDFDLQINVDLTGEKDLPAAVYLDDIRAGQVEARLVGEENSFEIVDINVATNAFDSQLSNIGPFRIGSIIRTPDDDLEVVNFILELGPPDAPFLVARADVENILELQGIVLAAQLDLPPEEVFRTLSPDTAAQFGHLTGTLDLSGSFNDALPTRIKLNAKDATLWSGQADVSTPDLFGEQQVSGAVNLNVPDGAALFSALQRRALNVGAFGLDLSFELARGALVTDWGLELGTSRIEANLSTEIKEGKPLVEGAVLSQRISVADLDNGARAIDEIFSLAGEMAGPHPNVEDQVEEFQPLVLPEPEAPPEEDLSDFQPLVLEPPSPTQSNPTTPIEEDLSDFQPLVLSTDLRSNLRLDDLGSFDALKQDIGVDITVDVRRLIGQQGLSYIKSRLRISNGQLRFGPLDIAYGGGKALMDASMNIVSSPGWLRLAGRAGGWQLADIVRDFELDIAASGVLNATFDVSGPTRSIESFLKNMKGRTTIELRSGRIGTSLIELAGLGVVPWLFSREKARGYANISCIHLPLIIDRGRVTTNGSVLETERVQVLGWGSADWVRNQIDLRAEPRPIGRPLARSAWPFTVTGALSDPQITKSRGRVRRPDTPLAMPERRVPCIPDYRQLVDPLDVP